MIKSTVQGDKQFPYIKFKLLRIPIHDSNHAYNKNNLKHTYKQTSKQTNKEPISILLSKVLNDNFIKIHVIIALTFFNTKILSL